MSLNALLGAAEFNSYLSVAEGDSLAATALGDIAWNNVTDEIDKEKGFGECHHLGGHAGLCWHQV